MDTSGVKYMIEPPPGQVRGSGATLQPELIASGVATTMVALIVVSLRIFTRTKVVHNGLHIDDCELRLLSSHSIRVIREN